MSRVVRLPLRLIVLIIASTTLSPFEVEIGSLLVSYTRRACLTSATAGNGTHAVYLPSSSSSSSSSPSSSPGCSICSLRRADVNNNAERLDGRGGGGNQKNGARLQRENQTGPSILKHTARKPRHTKLGERVNTIGGFPAETAEQHRQQHAPVC